MDKFGLFADHPPPLLVQVVIEWPRTVIPKKEIQRVPTLQAFWGLEKTVLHEIHVSGTVVSPPTNAKIPHLHVHKPKTVVVETVLVIFV